MVKPTMHQAQQYIYKVHDTLERRQVHELDSLRKARPAWLARRIATREQSNRITGAIQIGFAVRMYTAVHTNYTTLQSDKYEIQISSSISKPLCYLTSITSMYRSVSRLASRVSTSCVSASRVSASRVSACQRLASQRLAPQRLSISPIKSIE